MSTRYMLGKHPAVRPHSLKYLSVYVNGKLPSPPTSVNYYNGLSLPMDGNDQYGDCVMAATAHLLAAWNSEVEEEIPVPDSDEVVAEYFTLEYGSPVPDPSEDNGLSEADVLASWHTEGLFGSKIAAYAPVYYKDIIAVHQAIALYGGALFGIQVPQSAQEQFEAGQPWTYEPDSPILGGHAIAPLGYDEKYVYCATWGGIAPVTYPFLSAFLDEMWAIIPQAFVEAKKGPSLDLKSLQADIHQLSQER